MILAFDVKVEREAQEHADILGVRIFSADIIYHLFDNFLQHRKASNTSTVHHISLASLWTCHTHQAMLSPSSPPSFLAGAT